MLGWHYRISFEGPEVQIVSPQIGVPNVRPGFSDSRRIIDRIVLIR